VTVFPLIRHASLDAIVAYQKRRPIDAKTFLADVAALAETLPEGQHIVNFCADRYRFAVTLGAAMRRRQVTLLPPNDTPGLLTDIAAEYPEAYCLTDGHFTTPSMSVVRYPELRPARPEAYSVPAFPADQVAAIVFTSGSIGKPVGNIKTWGVLIRGTRAAGHRFGMDKLAGAVVGGTVPHQHMYGFESTVLLPMQHGLAIDSERPFYPADICARLEELPRPRMLITTPIHLRALIADEGDLPPVDFLLSATAPLTPQLAHTASRRFSTLLYEIYGCSEAGQVAMRRTAETDEWHCFDNISLRQDQGGTWAVCDAMDDDVLLNDVIELHGADRFLLHGRTADMINIAGKRTSLAHLNFHLNSIEGVRDGVFVMPPDNAGGTTRLMAFAVAPGLTAEAIVGALRTRIDAAFLPRPLQLVTNLPRNATGKLPFDAVSKLVAGVAGP
jgi:acyl-coenzyme A synthetase/AMP-(fatty) acid ligase